MLKLHLTVRSKNNWRSPQAIFIYSGAQLIQEIPNECPTSIPLHLVNDDLLITDGHTQRQISLAELKKNKQATIQLTADRSIQLRLSNQIKLFDYTNLLLASLSALIAIGYSLFTESNWNEFLFILGCTVLVVLLFMLLYGHPINARHYNTRMYATISSLVLIFILIPFENWTLKTLIGLSTLTVIARFIKDYQRSLSVVYDAFTKQ